MAPSPSRRASAWARSPRHETYSGTSPAPSAPGTGMSRIGRPPSGCGRSSPASRPRRSRTSRSRRARGTGPTPRVKPAREAGAHRGPHPSRRQGREGPQGRRGGRRRAQARHHHAHAQADARRAIGRPGEGGERVVVEQRRVVAPGRGEAELLRQRDVVRRVAHGGQEDPDPERAAHRATGASRDGGGGDGPARAPPDAACATPPPRRRGAGHGRHQERGAEALGHQVAARRGHPAEGAGRGRRAGRRGGSAPSSAAPRAPPV